MITRNTLYLSVVKTNPPPSPSITDPPWSRPSSGRDRPSSHAAPRSSYPDVRDQQRPTVKSDRRYSEVPRARYQPRERERERNPDRDRDRPHHMVSVKSTPNLHKAEATAGAPSQGESLSVKPVKSSSDIPDDVNKENQSYRKRPSGYEQQAINKPAAHTYGGSRLGPGEESGCGDLRGEKSKRYSEDMYTSDMRSPGEAQSITSHSLQKYQPDYENVSMLGTAPLQSEKISEIDDIDDSLDSDAPVVPPRPAGIKESRNPYSPTPPHRDPSSLKYIKVNQNHEKYPSWPVTQSSAAASDQSQPINTRAQSWTDHTNTSKEFPSKQKLAYQPGLRPLLEKNSPTSERKGEESSSGKAPRNSSDPGLKTPEFVYGRYGKVVQKRKEEDMKGRFEDFYQSKPGYLPPRFDSDGHSYGDKEYNAPSPPERDVVGVDRHALSQALGAEAGEQRQQPHPQQRQSQQAQPQEPHRAPSHYPGSSTMPPQQGGPPGGSSTRTTTANSPSHSPDQKKRPGFLQMSSQPARDSRRVDMATSPLASPRDSLSCPRDGPSRGVLSPSHRDYLHKDTTVVASSRQSHKPYIVRQTPYYNTSTQTDVQSYAVKMSDPRTRQCNVEIQVGDVSSQTSPKIQFEEKSIQARMSREFQPSELDQSSPKKLSPGDKRNYFRYPFEGMQSIQAKYGTDEDTTATSQPSDMLTPFASGDQASIMRKLSEEFYGGNKLGLMGDKRHSSASSQEHSPKPMDSSSVSVYSGTMSQAESYSSVVIHPSESAGPFGRDDFGSQSSIADSRHDLSSIASSSRTSLRDSAPRGRNSLEYFPRTATRPLQESKKFNSLSAISHQRENSAPVLSRHSAQSQSQESLPHKQDGLSVDTRWRNPSSYRESSSASEASSPSQPKTSPDARTSSSSHYSSQGESPTATSQPNARSAFAVQRHVRTESDSVFIESSTAGQKERSSGGSMAKASSLDSNAGRSGVRVGAQDFSQVGRKPSMKKAYGIYDENDRLLSSPTKDNRSCASSSSQETGTRMRGSYSDAKQLDQIEEEGGTQGDSSSTHQRLDSWRNDLDKRTGRMQRTTSEQISASRERSGRIYEPSSRPQRLFDGSIDSGVGSEISSRLDGQTTPSEPSQPSSLSTGADLKKFQQQAVLNFVHRKTSKSSFPSVSVEHSPESSLYESIGTPRSPHSPTSESVSDLISKTNENLAKRADSIRRSSSTSSRNSSSDYMDMNRQERSRKETEWSRLRSSGSFHYGSNRSSLCSENTYEDISVFATPSSRGSTQEVPKNAEGQNGDSVCPSDEEDDEDGGKMESGVMATYQNFPGSSSGRRPPPPPPRTPSPEPRTPPALPPRNYLRRDDEVDSQDGREEEGSVEEAKIDFKSLFTKFENNSPRENDYAAQIRKQAMKISGQRVSSSTAPTTMSLISSRTPMGLSTSYKQEPMVAHEATTPTSSVTGSVSVSSASSVSSVNSLSAGMPSAPRHSGLDISSAADNHLSMQPPSQTKEPPAQPHVAAAYVDRDTKPKLVTSPTNSRPPRLPERTVLPPREDNSASLRADNLPPRGESHLPRDRSGSEAPYRDSERSFLSVPDQPRDRSSSDTRVLAKLEGSASPIKDRSRSPSFRQADLPLPTPPKGDNLDGVVDPGELPPPPPELLNDSCGTFDKGEQQGDDPFADDSYGAYKNRSSRQVGTYKRSSSAAVIPTDNHHLKAATDAQAVFGDRKLGNQNWSSDSQLQSGRGRDVQQGGVAGGNGNEGPPGRPPERPGNVPAFRAESSTSRNVVKVTGGTQPLTSHPHPRGQSPSGRGDVKTFTARPFHVEQQANSAEQPRGTVNEEAKNGSGASPKQPRSVKDRISNLERKSSFSSSSSSSTTTPITSPMHTASVTPTSSSQRWANAAPFEATHRTGGETVKPPRGNNNNNNSSYNNRVPNPNSMVLTNSYQPRDRPPSGSPSHAALNPSTQNSVSARPRAFSERARNDDVAPSFEPKQNQRYAEVAPMASDFKALPGHVRNTAQNSVDRPRSTSSPYNRRESAPAPQLPPPETAIAMVSPRRKSEGNFLSSNPDTDKDGSPPPGEITISHGRQPSQEELECDQRAKELAKEVAGSEKKLSEVLKEDATQKRMKYMDGLFSGQTDVDVKTPASVRRHQSQGSGDFTSQRSPLQVQKPAAPQSEEDHTQKRNSLPKEYFVSPPKAVLEMEWRNKEEAATDLTKNIHDNEALIRQKEELIEKLYKKLDLLKEERKGLQEEIEENEALGKRVCDTVECKCQNTSEKEKFRNYIEDLEKIIRLLLNLSGQLARAENAVQGLAENADPKLKSMTLDKREKLKVKHAEAKQLKEHIDKRSDTVSAFLRQSLTGEELNDYAYFVKMKSKLTIEFQELEDKITLGLEQIQELKKSIPEHTATPVPESVSSTSSSPRSSPVPSS